MAEVRNLFSIKEKNESPDAQKMVLIQTVTRGKLMLSTEITNRNVEKKKQSLQKAVRCRQAAPLLDMQLMISAQVLHHRNIRQATALCHD